MKPLQSVVISQRGDGTWQAVHIPSGKTASGPSREGAEEAMRQALGMDETGDFSEPTTQARFEGIAQEIAAFLEGEVSAMLAAHSGFARLEGYSQGVAEIRLGGGCSGCPSSQMTLLHGVRNQLIDRFGEEHIVDVLPVLD